MPCLGLIERVALHDGASYAMSTLRPSRGPPGARASVVGTERRLATPTASDAEKLKALSQLAEVWFPTTEGGNHSGDGAGVEMSPAQLMKHVCEAMVQVAVDEVRASEVQAGELSLVCERMRAVARLDTR